MALVDQTFRLRFTQGVDTEPDDKSLPAGKLTRLENGTFEKATTLEKRPGHDALTRQFQPTNIVISGALDVWSDGHTLYRHNGRNIAMAYGDGTAWKIAGFMRSPTVDTQKLLKGPVERWNGDIATAPSASVALSAWEQADGVYMALLDADDLTPIYGPERIGASTRPRVVLCGTQLHVYHHNGTQLGCVRINPYDHYMSWRNWESTALTTDLDARSALAYDVVPHNGGVLLAYPSSAGDVKLANVAPIASIATTGSAFSRPNPVNTGLGYIDAGPTLAISAQGYAHVHAWKSGSGVVKTVFDANTSVEVPQSGVLVAYDQEFFTGDEVNPSTTPNVPGGVYTTASIGTLISSQLPSGWKFGIDDTLTAWFSFTGSIFSVKWDSEFPVEGTGAPQLRDILGFTTDALDFDSTLVPYTGSEPVTVRDGSYRVLDSTVTTANGDTVVRLTSECEAERQAVSGSDCVAVCFYEVTSSAGSRIRYAGMDAANSASYEDEHLVHRSKIVGRPYAIHADVYCPVMSTEPTQQTAFLVDTGARPVAKMMPGLASPLTSGTVPAWGRLVDGRDAIILGRRDQVPTFYNQDGNVTGSSFSDRGMALATVRWDATASLDWATKDGYVFVGGGQLHMLDGASVTEVGFHVDVEGATYTPFSIGSGGMLTGTFIYSPTYEWTDRYGHRHLSTGEFVRVTLTGTQNAVSCSLPTPQFTLKGTTAVFNAANESVRVAMWRSKVGGSTLFRADAPTSPIVVSQTSSFHPYSDRASDATIGEIDPRTIYVENVAPPAARHVSVVNGRVMLAGTEGRPQDVWYSKLNDVDGAGPSFSDRNVFPVAAEGGPITGLGQIDANGIVFKQDRALAFGGNGPTDLDADTSLFSEPQTVETDAGCVDSRSIVTVQGSAAQGLIFKSRKGYKLLDRGFNVHDIGAPVSDHDGLQVASVLREPGTDRVRFLNRDGLTLMFDSRWGQWSTYTQCQGVGSAVWRDGYVYLRDDGTVMVPSTGSRDATSTYPMLFETGWLTFNGLQGYNRCRSLHLLGDYHSPHTLRIDVAYDYRGYSETHRLDTSRFIRTAGSYGSGSYGSGSYGGYTTDPVYQVKVNFKRQRCQAIRLRVSDVTDQTGGKSYSVSEIALTVAVEKGQARLSSRKRSG